MRTLRPLIAAAALAACLPASAALVTLGFEDISVFDVDAAEFSPAQILDFYADQGVVFNPVAYAVVALGSQGTANTINVPGGVAVMAIVAGQGVANVANGFDTGFSLSYSTISEAATVALFAGLDGQGSLLATLNLANLGTGATGGWENWATAAASFQGVAHSVVFGGTSLRVVFDNVTFSNLLPAGAPPPVVIPPIDPPPPLPPPLDPPPVVIPPIDPPVVTPPMSPIPEPSTYALMAVGLAAVGFATRRRRSR